MPVTQLSCQVDEEALYVTVSYTNVTSGPIVRTELLALEKGLTDNVNGLYSTSTSNPARSVLELYNQTTDAGAAEINVPALVWDPDGAGPNIGTYACGYIGPMNMV